MKNNADVKAYRTLAGNLELFLGAYFVAFGFLAVLYFTRLENRDGVLVAAAGILTGWLLVWRAARLLAWRRWVFWVVTLLMILIPIVWLVPAVMPIIP
jgi:hypothetical protein